MPRRNNIRRKQFVVILIVIGIWFIGFASVVGSAQVDCVMPRQLTVSVVRGQVFDPTGVAIPDALISFMKSGTSAVQVKTDEAGRFRIDNVSGLHTFMAESSGFQQATIKLNVGRDVHSLLHATNLHVILGLVGSFCPLITSSKREFEQEIRANKKRIQEVAKNNATQK